MSFPNGEVTCPLITVNPVLGFNSLLEVIEQICEYEFCMLVVG
jgi:hypothetical protein